MSKLITWLLNEFPAPDVQDKERGQDSRDGLRPNPYLAHGVQRGIHLL